MNGPEHYRAALRLREQAAEAQGAAYDDRGNLFARWNAEYMNAAAQVHATLALAAAAAGPIIERYIGEIGADAQAWAAATAPDEGVPA